MPRQKDTVDVNQLDYSSLLTSALNLQRRMPGDLEPTLNASIQLDDWTLPEFWSLRKGTAWQKYVTLGAVALQKSFVQVLGGQGMVTILERVVVVNPTGVGQTFIYGITAFEAAAGGGFVGPMDDRYWGASSPGTLITGSTAVAPSVGNQGYAVVPAGATADIPLGRGVVLTGTPNAAGVVPVWKIVNNVVNVGVDVVLFWRERPILPSEK